MKSTDQNFGYHPVTVLHAQYPPTHGGVYQNSEHIFSVYNQGFSTPIPDYLTPNFAELSYEYWTNKVPSKGWMNF